jgi:CRISPR-associated protein Cmr4
MFEKSAIGIFIVETPLHCGVGQDIGIVDQPIQRERYTRYPIIHGSEIKGVFRQYYERKYNKGNNVEEIFGPENSGEEGGDYASAVSFGDARILFFPVKSLKGTYVWITSKDVLDKFNRTLKMAGINDIRIPSIPSIRDNQIIVYNNSIVVDNKVILEEYMFEKQNGNANDFESLKGLIEKIVPNVDEYQYLKNCLKEKICIVSDEVFREFTEMSTEVITRIKINNDTGVVEKGALWTEEYLPTDTILYFPVFAVKTRSKETQQLSADEVLNKIKSLNTYLQIGGNETVGKGFVRINWISPNSTTSASNNNSNENSNKEG